MQGAFAVQGFESYARASALGCSASWLSVIAGWRRGWGTGAGSRLRALCVRGCAVRGSNVQRRRARALAGVRCRPVKVVVFTYHFSPKDGDSTFFLNNHPHMRQCAAVLVVSVVLSRSTQNDLSVRTNTMWLLELLPPGPARRCARSLVFTGGPAPPNPSVAGVAFYFLARRASFFPIWPGPAHLARPTLTRNCACPGGICQSGE